MFLLSCTTQPQTGTLSGVIHLSGETDASVYFEIKDIPTGVYNVVTIKDLFGFKYIYNLQIDNGSNSLENFFAEKKKGKY